MTIPHHHHHPVTSAASAAAVRATSCKSGKNKGSSSSSGGVGAGASSSSSSKSKSKGKTDQASSSSSAAVTAVLAPQQHPHHTYPYPHTPVWTYIPTDWHMLRVLSYSTFTSQTLLVFLFLEVKVDVDEVSSNHCSSRSNMGAVGGGGLIGGSFHPVSGDDWLLQLTTQFQRRPCSTQSKYWSPTRPLIGVVLRGG